MRIPTWRLVLTGGAVTVLAIAGIGFVAASNVTGAPAADVAMADPTVAPHSAPGLGERQRDRLGGGGPDGWRAARMLRFGRHLVHAEVTVTDRDGNLVYLQLDHGTVQSIGDGRLVIAEAGGGTETVLLDESTIVRLGRENGDLGDVTVGAEVFVKSRTDGSTVLAKRILIIPAAAT